MKLVLETKPNTEFRKNELNKLQNKLYYYYNNYDDEGPFCCFYQCEDYTDGCAEKCIKERIQQLIKKIDEEGVLYF